MLLLNSSQSAFAQNAYHGSVIDSATSQGIPGVSVTIKGTTKGTQTDAAGKFILPAKKGDVLLLRFVGYRPAEHVIGDETEIDLRLSPATKGLDEVVIVAYGAQKKKDILGAVSTIDVAQQQGAIATNPSRLLQG